MQRLWAVLQGAWEREANRAEEGQYPDQEEKVHQDRGYLHRLQSLLHLQLQLNVPQHSGGSVPASLLHVRLLHPNVKHVLQLLLVTVSGSVLASLYFSVTSSTFSSILLLLVQYYLFIRLLSFYE